MSRPRLLDLFCGAGGAAMGYYRAEFDVVGVDIQPQPHYPFEFHRGDAMSWPLEGYDAIHASPPCQAYSTTRFMTKRGDHPQLLDPCRRRLVASGLPWVIENVIGAPMTTHITLCGLHFGLNVYRHRLFESNVFILAMPHPRHKERTYARGGTVCEVYGANAGWRDKQKKHWGDAMGIDWMTPYELSQAIPPAYTEYIGRQLIAALDWEESTA